MKHKAPEFSFMSQMPKMLRNIRETHKKHAESEKKMLLTYKNVSGNNRKYQKKIEQETFKASASMQHISKTDRYFSNMVIEGLINLPHKSEPC